MKNGKIGPATVQRSPHKGLVTIPFPELPQPIRRKPIQSKPKELPPVSLPVVTPISKPKTPKTPVGPPRTEEIVYPKSEITIEDDQDRVKDMGKFVIEPTEWS